MSKALRRMCRDMIDRTRWPVLITYSDEGLSHDGHVYKCSGWKKTTRSRSALYENEDGRASSYSNGVTGGRDLKKTGYSYIQRWEKRSCPKGEELDWMTDHGWIREVRNGKGVWVNTRNQIKLFGSQ